jgi:hypothetical protein
MRGVLIYATFAVYQQQQMLKTQADDSCCAASAAKPLGCNAHGIGIFEE